MSDIIEFLKSRYDVDAESGIYDDNSLYVMKSLITIYDRIIEYYMYIDAEQMPSPDIWPPDFLHTVYNACNIITTTCDLNIFSPIYKDITPYYREIYYGLGLILSQLAIIYKHYMTLGITSPVNFIPRHSERFIRLLNNLCVIMFHNKFKWVDLPADGTEPYKEAESQEWQIQFQPTKDDERNFYK